MRDDLDYEERKKKGSKDSIVKATLKQAFAPLVLSDSIKNSLLSKDRTMKETFKKATENYPDSVFENPYESIDAIESHFPKFVAENPNTAAALGVIADIADPVSYGVLKAGKMAKIPTPMLAELTMKMGDKLADSGTTKWVQKLTKKQDMSEVPKIAKYIKREGLRGELGTPEKVLEKLRGKEKLKMEGPSGLEVVSSEKVSEGTLDKVGDKIKQTLRLADMKGAPKVNRADIFETMRNARIAKNSDDRIAKKASDLDMDKHDETLKNILTPYETKRAIFPAKEVKKPDLMPQVEESFTDEMLAKLSKDAEKSKTLKLNIEEQAKIRKAAENQAKKDNEALAKSQMKAVESDNAGKLKLKEEVKGEKAQTLAEREKIKAAQKAEREKAEKLVGKENEKISKTNQSLEEQILSLNMQKKMKNSRPKPMDEIPVPKAQKNLPPLPAKEILDIKKHNKKAAIVNKQYMDLDELPKPKDLEAQIAELRAKMQSPKDVEVPPPMTDDMFPPVKDSSLPEIPNKIETDQLLAKKPVDVDVPPAMPHEGVRPLEEILAEIQDVKNAKANLGKTNSKIAKENQSKMSAYQADKKTAVPQVMEVTTPKMSPLERLWELKFSIRQQLREADYDKSIMDLPEHKRMLMETLHRVEGAIQKSADNVNIMDGNAGDVYRHLNDDYGTQKMLDELLVDETLNNWKGGGKRKGGAIPAITAGVASALAAKTAGTSVPMAAILGGIGGETARRGVFAGIPELQAKWANKLSKPEGAHVVTQTAMEMAEVPHEYGRGHVEREGHDASEQGDDFDPMKVNFKKSSPELQRILKQNRKPDSVDTYTPPENEIDEKMNEVLAPGRQLFDPYINEELLNTPLPRDSKRLLQNQEVLLAKVQQLAPDKVGILKDMLSNDPETMQENGGKIAMLFPDVFEKDKYGMFDGKIVDPQMQEKFLLDLSDDESMSSIEKANMAMKVRRGESIHG